jgi:hypothetical protein
MSEDEDTLDDLGEEDGLWFDFTFVEFLKTNYSAFSLFSPFQVPPRTEPTSLWWQSPSSERFSSIPTRRNQVASAACSVVSSSLADHLSFFFLLSGRSIDTSESPEVVAALRASIASQTQELEEMRSQILALQAERDEEVRLLAPASPLALFRCCRVKSFASSRQQRVAFRHEVSNLTEQVVSLRTELSEARAAKDEADKEQEDVRRLPFVASSVYRRLLNLFLRLQLLVLLEEVSSKRKADKAKMRAAEMEVSEDEDEDDDEEAWAELAHAWVAV